MDVTGMSAGEQVLRRELKDVENQAVSARGRERIAREEAERLENNANAIRADILAVVAART